MHFGLTDEEAAAYRSALERMLGAYGRMNEMEDVRLEVGYPREPGRAPAAAENPLGAWAWICSVKGREEGPLAGRRIAVKDAIAVAGQPLRLGSPVMEGFIAEFDATVVTRVLDAGGEIVGKAICEAFCVSGGSNSSDPTPVLNPHDTTRMAGGSSSGCAALVASGACDMALATDVGGSIREPSSWSGSVGLKPTRGLVPCTGVVPLEHSLETVGPMTATVADAALLLDVIAGPDGLDARGAGFEHSLPRFSDSLSGDCAGLRIGVVREGFAWPDASEQDVDDTVLAAAEKLARLGADVHEVSIPAHRDSVNIQNGIVVEGIWSTVIRGELLGQGWVGHYDTRLLDFYSEARRTRADAYPPSLKLLGLAGSYMNELYHGHYYAKGQNLRRWLRAAYDEAFEHLDVLLMPTTSHKALTFDPSRTLAEELVVFWNTNPNTSAANLTGYPALSVPCGWSQGLPVGMMLVGPRLGEGTILRVGDAFERR